MLEQKRKIAFFDIDRTAYDGYLVFSLVEVEARDGIIEKAVSQEMNDLKDKNQHGIISYPQMVKEVVELWAQGLKGKSFNEVLIHTENYLKGEGNKFFSYVGEVVDLIRNTYDVFFVTGGTQFTAKATRDIFKGKGYLSTEFEVDESGLFTGKVKTVLAVGEHKLEAIKDLVETHNRKDSLAFGDTESDRDMLEEVDFPICVDPNDILKRDAEMKGWPIFYSKGTPSTDEIVDYVKFKIIK